MARIKKAVIPAAGFGTRFLPATKATPKEMLPIVDKPTIQYIVEEALASGIEEILIISGHAKRAIEDHFDSAPVLERELEEKGKDDLLAIVRETADINVHYIRQKKTEEAKLLLSGTRMSISEISDELSFSSRSYFFSSFQKETGMSPTKYRQLYTKS